MTTIYPEINSVLLPRREVNADQLEEMYQLLALHFDGVTRQGFVKDLAAKNWVILIRREQRLVGLSTLLVYESLFEGETVSVVYSGDTIMAREAWGTMALARTWITAVNQLRESYSRGKYYWLLLTSGFRTYRFLPVFWREFYPRFDAIAPGATAKLRDHLAQERFGQQHQSGIVRFAQPQRLRAGLADIPAGRLSDPHVAFFLSRNPGYRNGDELVCLTELNSENLTNAGHRMVAPRHGEISCYNH